jgi:hypothetical protein
VPVGDGVTVCVEVLVAVSVSVGVAVLEGVEEGVTGVDEALRTDGTTGCADGMLGELWPLSMYAATAMSASPVIPKNP